MNFGPTYSYTGTPIHAVYAQRNAYDSYPACQRDYVWTRGMQQKLIDSILRGLPIPPITLLPASDHAFVGTRFWVVDGQQRLKTILKFMDGDFKTASSFTMEPGIKPCEPGRTYEELSPQAQEAFKFYQLQFCFINNVEARETGLIYRRFNYQVKLMFSEALYSYESKAKTIANNLFDHPFWSHVYIGNKDRKQVFVMGLHTIFMEVMDVFANMTSPRLAEIVYGTKDAELSPKLEKKIRRTLDGLDTVFDGATFHTIGSIIPIYQAGLLLEADGYDLSRSQPGCLASWFMTVRQGAIESRRQGISDPLGILNNVNRQRSFWVQHLPTLYANPGLFRKDTQRLFTELEKIVAWNRQNGKCVVCGKSVRISDEGHHLVPHTEGGRTTADNCILVHSECHASIHANQTKLDIVTE